MYVGSASTRDRCAVAFVRHYLRAAARPMKVQRTAGYRMELLGVLLP